MKAAAVIALLAAAASPCRAQWTRQVYPDPDQVFLRPVADPRRAQTTARYYRLGGRNMGDLAVGNSWGWLRWTKEDVSVQWDLEGMAYSRFHVTGGINEFETIDFFLNVPVSVRRGPVSGQAVLFHQSSHLGDDFIRRTGNTGFRYSVEGFRLLGSLDAGRFLRLYSGPTFLLHAIPRVQSALVQWGFEARTPKLTRWTNQPFAVYLAQDFQARSQVDWNVNSNTELGVRLAFKDVIRSMRVHANYFDGYSPFGQFFRQREHMLSIGVTLDF